MNRQKANTRIVSNSQRNTSPKRTTLCLASRPLGSIISRSTNQRRARPKEFSVKVKQIIQRLRFKVKALLISQKAKEHITAHTEELHPGYRNLVKILKNSYRSNENIQHIIIYLQSLAFFSKAFHDLKILHEKAISQLCRCLKYEYIPAGKYVFQEDDPSNNKYYVVLTGTVELTQRKNCNIFFYTRLNEGLEQSKLSKSDTKSILENVSKANNNSNIKIAELKEGQGFGEKALVDTSALRTASAFTKTNCELIVIMKEDYVNIISRFDVRRNAKLEFMKGYIPELNALSSLAILNDLFYFIQEHDYSKHNVIMKEKEIGDSIFFIGSGECTIEKALSMKRKVDKDTSESINVEKVISVAGVGTCFGEEILLGDGQCYKYTVKVQSSAATVYCISKVSLLQRFPPDCIKAIIYNFRKKQKIHQIRINEITKDLFDTTFGKSRLETNSKNKELFSVLSPQYQRKMAQRIDKKRELEEKLASFEHRAEDFQSREIKVSERRKKNEVIDNNDSDLQLSNEIIMLSKKIEKSRNERPTTALPIRTEQLERSTTRKVSHLRSRNIRKLQIEINSLEDNLQSEIKNDHFTNTIDNETSPRSWIMNATKSVTHKAQNFKLLRNYSAKENIEAKCKRITTSRVIDNPSDSSEIKIDKFDFGDVVSSQNNSCIRSPKSMKQIVSTEHNPYLVKIDQIEDVSRINELNLRLSSRSPITDPDTFASSWDRFRSERISPILFDKVDKLIKEKISGKKSNRVYGNCQGMPMAIRTTTTNFHIENDNICKSIRSITNRETGLKKELISRSGTVLSGNKNASLIGENSSNISFIVNGVNKSLASSPKVNMIYRMATREVRKIHEKFRKSERKI